jgi:AraC-like DNA-binding protein
MPPDALSEIVGSLRMRGTVYFHTHFTPPWSVEVPAYRNVTRFHIAVRGVTWVRVAGEQVPIRLAAGDLIVVPHGALHILSDDPERAPLALDEVLRQSGYDGHGALTYGGEAGDHPSQLFCGHFEFDDGALHPLLASLPASIVIRGDDSLNAGWLDPIMGFVQQQVKGGRAGAEAIVHRLTEILFIQVVRAFVDRAGEAAGCLAGVLDENLGRALSAVHVAPEKDWTVEAMAQQAGLSRTVFAARFRRMIGLTPLDYVMRWRMHEARRRLIDTKASLVEIADAVGYRSEAAFARAFKRRFGASPGSFKRQAD